MINYILVTSKPWHNILFDKLSRRNGERWTRISKTNQFTLAYLNKLTPKKIFIPHWSNIIPEEIFLKYDCVLFHMTDLPFGRGGSPLQNLILKGYKDTKISALKVTEGIDEGPIYLKRTLDLHGSASEIFERSSVVICKMIVKIIKNSLTPASQIGEPTIFKRRKPSQSDISKLNKLSKIYDYIRMMDCDGYPKAFIELNGLKYEFTNVRNNKNTLEANVRIKYN
jgi:methionyl-tRNA formyltransferase